MTDQEVLDITRQALYLIIECSAPLLLTSLIVGLIVSILQTLTSIQEQTLTFVPKIIAVFISLMIFGVWIANNITSYIENLWSNFSYYIGR